MRIPGEQDFNRKRLESNLSMILTSDQSLLFSPVGRQQALHCCCAEPSRCGLGRRLNETHLAFLSPSLRLPCWRSFTQGGRGGLGRVPLTEWRHRRTSFTMTQCYQTMQKVLKDSHREGAVPMTSPRPVLFLFLLTFSCG